ncbi:surface protease GP63, partial [Trypanosoma cruzi]
GRSCQTLHVGSVFQWLVCRRSIHERSAKRPMDSCPVIGPALDVRNAAAVIWRGECLSAVPGDKPSSWCLDTLPTNTTDARDPEETYISVLSCMRHCGVSACGCV